MTELNLVNLKQNAGLLSAPEKLQKGKAGKDAEQMMPFVCVMGKAYRETTQKTEGIPPDPRLGKGKIGGRSNKGNAIRPGGAFNIDQENNILSEGKGKTDQSLPIKSKGTKINKSFSGKIVLLSKKDSQNQTQGEVKDLQRSSGLKKSKTERINPVLTGDAKGPLKPILNKQNIESGLTKSGLIKAVVEKKETPVRVGIDALIDPTKKQALYSGVGNKKGAPPVFKENAPGFLKTGLQNAVAVKGKNAVEPDKTEKNAFMLTKNDSGKNEIKNILTPSGFKSGETIEILHRETSPPDRSSNRVFSVGGYHNTTFHSGGGSTAINESVKSHAIEPRILINRIAAGVKRPGRIRITLNPPRLGTLDVNVLVRNNKVHVMLQSENNDVKQILQSNVESLKSAFRNHGLVADTINVSVQEKSGGADYGANYRSGQNETLFKEGGNWKGNQEDHGEGQNSVNPDSISLKEENPLDWSDEHGGRVSLFA